ncbi:DUF2177 family protein [Altererythrobacter lutimaris]|uniref:DUF2177 family protein n=1 Tax=Altererythrobacter lutimaris TaxID=2743979 RepID=A0A850H9Z1_9SPHN|nr:DUF2177 family protein [Altererythrobacter lutimaris]NVE93706.1 DUF2177 family protein [Altererythrobacter lutimaris]
MKWIIAYISAAVAFGVLDSLWLRWAGPNLYRPVIGEIMAENFRAGAAAAFYFIYLAGMVWFAIKPGLASGSVATAVLNGALLGALCYATFDLTSQAVFKVWATHVTVIDIMWGAFATATASAVATWVTLKLTS